MKNCLHRECYARSCQEIEEVKRRCYQEENAVRRQKLEEFLAQHDHESRTVSLLQDQVRRLQERSEFIEDSKIFQDPDSPSSFDSAHVLHQALITSSSRKPSRESRMQRTTREDMRIPGNVFDCQPARRDPDDLHNNPSNLATSPGVLRREGIEKSGSEEPLQSILLPCFQERARQKKSRLWKLSYVYDKLPFCGYWDLYSEWHASSEMHLVKFPDHKEFQSWIVNFPTEVCWKAKHPTTVDQGDRNSQLAGGPHHAKINNGQNDFPDL